MLVLDDAYRKYKSHDFPEPAYYMSKEPTREVARRILRTRDAVAELMLYTNRVLYLEHVVLNFNKIFKQNTVLSIGNNSLVPDDVAKEMDNILHEFQTLLDGKHHWGRDDYDYGIGFQKHGMIQVYGINNNDKNVGYSLLSFEYYGKTLVNSIEIEEQQLLDDIISNSTDGKIYEYNDDSVQIRNNGVKGINGAVVDLNSILTEDDVLFNLELDNGTTLEYKMIKSIPGFNNCKVNINHISYQDEYRRIINYGTEIMGHVFASVSTKIMALVDKLSTGVEVYVMQGTNKPLPLHKTEGYVALFDALTYMINNNLQEKVHAKLELITP